MAKTIILGSRNSVDLASQIDATLIEVPDIYENDFGTVNDFVIDKLRQEFDILVIDADNIQRTDVALALGLYLRLSVMEVGANALAPIIIASDFRMKKFLHTKTYSQLLLTKNVYFQARQEIIIDAVMPLVAERYEDDFLDFISVKSGPEIGRHSLANQWGASVLDRLLNNGVPSDNEVLKAASKSLYFKYMFVQTVNIADVLSGKQPVQYAMTSRATVNAKGKRVLLIDDEADKGWEYVLRRFVITNDGDFDVIGHRVKNYDAFSKEERDMIKNGNYDLIFLDLRMNGIEEEHIYKPEEFSGMKILRKIKDINPGTQVIMFTASNKAWNLKALLDAGADGYYIKESPEYKFSQGFSIANFESLRDNIQKCLSRNYLREIDARIRAIRKVFNINNTGLKTSVINQFAASYALLKIGQFEFAYISLYQIIELINDEYFDRDDKGKWFIIQSGEYAKSWSTNTHKECVEMVAKEDENVKYPEWQKAASLYYQLWHQNDMSFGYRLKELINERNRFMHNDCPKNSLVHTQEGYMRLFDVIETLCDLL